METINETISNAKNEVKKLIKDAHEKNLDPEPGRTMMESFENKVNTVCNLNHYNFFFFFSFYTFLFFLSDFSSLLNLNVHVLFRC